MSDTGATTLQIVNALGSAMAAINGGLYTTQLSSSNVYDPLDPRITQSNVDTDFPKIFVFFFDRDTEFFPQKRRKHTGNFVIEAQFKTTSALTAAGQVQALNFLRDVEEYFLQNYTLGSLAEEIRLCKIQAGAIQGSQNNWAAIAFLEVEWFNQVG